MTSMSMLSYTELPKGAILHQGKYRIMHTLGKSGYGITYRALALLSKQDGTYVAPVVVKELFCKDTCGRNKITGQVEITNPDQKPSFDTVKRRLLKENKLLYGLNHPHIVRLNEVFEENNTVYRVMDYIEGKDLQKLIAASGKCTLQQIAGYVLCICSALQQLHEKKILHRNIRPANILLDIEDQARLTDTGIAPVFTGEGAVFPDITEPFLPIEQSTPGVEIEFRPQTDIYALGATLYYALTGKKLAPAGDRLQQEEEGFIPPSKLNKTVSPYLDSVLKKAVAPVLTDRFATIESFENAFFGEEEYYRTLAQAEALETEKKPDQALPLYRKAYHILDLDNALKEKIQTVDKVVTEQRLLEEERVKKQAAFDNFYKQGRRAFEQQQYREAQELFIKAAEVFPQNQENRDKIDRYRRDMEKLRKEEETLVKRREENRQKTEEDRLSEQKRTEILVQEYERKGDEKRMSGCFAEAIVFYRQALDWQPQREYSLQAIKECQDELTIEESRLFKHHSNGAAFLAAIKARARAKANSKRQKKIIIVVCVLVAILLFFFIRDVVKDNKVAGTHNKEKKPAATGFTPADLKKMYGYNYVWDFSEGLALVEKDFKYGFVDPKGKVIIPVQYDLAWNFSEGLAEVKKNKKWGFIDRTGKMVIPLLYDDAGVFSQGLAKVKKKRKYGFIDKTGKMVVGFKYEDAESFSDGLARVKRWGKYGFVNQTGKVVIPIEYQDAKSFSEGTAKVKKGNVWILIDKTGAVIEQ